MRQRQRDRAGRVEEARGREFNYCRGVAVAVLGCSRSFFPCLHILFYPFLRRLVAQGLSKLCFTSSHAGTAANKPSIFKTVHVQLASTACSPIGFQPKSTTSRDLLTVRFTKDFIKMRCLSLLFSVLALGEAAVIPRSPQIARDVPCNWTISFLDYVPSAPLVNFVLHRQQDSYTLCTGSFSSTPSLQSCSYYQFANGTRSGPLSADDAQNLRWSIPSYDATPGQEQIAIEVVSHSEQ